MHERQLVADALETFLQLFDGAVVDQIQIAVGPGVDVELAEREWGAMTTRTALAGVHVTWEQAFDLLSCDACGQEFQGEPLDSCPYCGGDAMVSEPALPISLASWGREAAPVPTSRATRR